MDFQTWVKAQGPPGGKRKKEGCGRLRPHSLALQLFSVQDAELELAFEAVIKVYLSRREERTNIV